MVKADRLDPHTITHAMLDGDFYASSGVILKDVSIRDNTFTVVVDTCATDQELSSSFLYGDRVREGKPGYTIEFIGKNGKVLKSVKDTKANFSLSGLEGYVRCKISLIQRGIDKPLQGYFAWTQPVFTDNRK
jgi:hypothetical protein